MANLKQAGPERFEDAASYLAKYELYDTAFKLYKDDQEKLIASFLFFFFFFIRDEILIQEKKKVIHDLYGDYLYDRREYTDSALCEL